MRIARLGTALLLAFAGCSPPSLDTGAVRAALEEQTAAWDAAANSRDVEAVVSLHEENGVRMNANEPAHVGADAIRASFLAAWESDEAECTNQISEVHTAGEYAAVRGTFSCNVTPGDGSEPYEDRGKWANLSRRQPDGSWKIVWNIWNSDLAPRSSGSDQ